MSETYELQSALEDAELRLTEAEARAVISEGERGNWLATLLAQSKRADAAEAREAALREALEWVLDQVSWRDHYYWDWSDAPPIIKRSTGSCTDSPIIDDAALVTPSPAAERYKAMQRVYEAAKQYRTFKVTLKEPSRVKAAVASLDAYELNAKLNYRALGNT